MTGPWDKFKEAPAAAADDGPWSKFQDEPAPPAAQLGDIAAPAPPRTGRDANDQMLFPSSFIEQTPNVVPGIVADATRMARPFRDFVAPTGETLPQPAVAPDPVELPFVDMLQEFGKAGFSKGVGGTIRGIGEAVQAPFKALEGTALGDLVAPAIASVQPTVDEGAMVYDLGKAQSAAASVGGINPQTVDQFAEQALADPEGALRYLSGIGAESASQMLMAIATRNPRAAMAMTGVLSGGQTYGQQRADGASISEAQLQASVASLLEVVSSKAAIDTALGGKTGLGRRLLTVPGLEAASEASAGGTQSVAGDIVAGREVDSEKAVLQTALGGIVGYGMGQGEAVLGKGPSDPAAGIEFAGVSPDVVADVVRQMTRTSTPTEQVQPGPAPAAAAPPAAAPVGGAAAVAEPPKEENPRTREQREAERQQGVAKFSYGELDGQEFKIADSMFGGDADVRIVVRPDGSVTAWEKDGSFVDITNMVKAGYTIERALGQAYGSQPDGVAPDETKVSRAGAPAPQPDIEAQLGELLNPTPQPVVPGGETPQASGPAAGSDLDLDAILADPSIAAALGDLLGGAAPSEASAPAAPAGAGGSVTPGGAVSSAGARATPAQLDQALAMDEDAYIQAVNPSGKRSGAEDEIAFAADDIDTPADAKVQPDLSFTDKQGRQVQVLESPAGALYAQVDGQTVGLIEASDGETLNQVAKEFQGAGIGTGLARAQLLRDPMTPAGSFSEAGERTRRAAFRQLRAERAPAPVADVAALGDIAAPANDWLGEFFTPEAEAEASGRRAAEGSRRTGLSGELRARAEAARASAKDWEGRQYRANRGQVEFEGDGPGRETVSIGGVNERRRQRAMAEATAQAAALDGLADKIDRGDDAGVREAVATADKMVETRPGEADMLVGALFGAGNQSGPNSIGGIIRAAYREGAQPAPEALGDVAVPRETPSREPVRGVDRSLSFLRDEIGWAGIGGRMIRDGEVENREDSGASFGRTGGDVVGRTPWIPKTDPGGRPSEFWRGRPDKLTPAEANTALDRYEAGEPLTKRQQRFIDHARETAAGYDRDQAAEAAIVAEFDQNERDAAIFAMREADIDVEPEDAGEALALYELTARAIEAGADPVDVAPFADEPARAHAARLWAIIRGTPNADARATPEDRGTGQENRRDAEPAPAPARQQAGLFGAPTAREIVDSARRDRDAERDGRTGTGRTDMASGAGELFAGPRPAQASIPDEAPESRSTRDPAKPRDRLQQQDGAQPSQLAADAAVDATVEGARRAVRQLQAMVSPEAKAVRAQLGTAARHITVVDGPADLDPDVRARLNPSERAEGVYDPKTGMAYVFRIDPRTGRPVPVARVLWVGFHEVAGHIGLRGAALKLGGGDRGAGGRILVDALDRAGKNETVRMLRDATLRESPDYNPTLATEEALAELAAAIRTGNYAGIEARYGVRVPSSLRAGLRGDIARLVEAFKAFLRRVLGGDATFTDAQVYQLLDDAWQYAQTAPVGETGRDGVQAAESRESQPFYSALARAVDQAKGAPKRGDAAAWKGWLDGAQRRGEFKQAERDWLGVDAWLDGRGTTTREDLAEFIRANEVQVQDVVLGDDERTVIQDRIDEINEEFNALVDEYGPIPGMPPEAKKRADEIEAEHERLVDELRASRDNQKPTKFSSYQLPGGQNYRELLLTMPKDGAKTLTARERAAVEQYEFFSATLSEATTAAEEQHARRAMENLRQRIPSAFEPTEDYRSSHFDQPNILAHVRFNERTDADGKRVLFIEEIQSDWHQAGRKRGYVADEAPRVATKLERKDGFWEVTDQFGNFATNVMEYDVPRDVSDARVLEVAQMKIDRDIVGQAARDERVPNAPFKGSDEWAMLAFKRMARHAVDNGFDRIAWTTGEQQNARYDLAKQVDMIVVTPKPEGKRRVAIAVNGGSNVVFDVDKNGALENVSDNNAQLRGKALDEVVGKDMAEKIMAAERATFEGADLAIGGDGMRGFYDKILPSAVNKWAKKFGGKVGVTTKPEAGQVIPDKASPGRFEVISADGQPLGSFASRDQADARLAREQERAPGLNAGQHALDITPAMREAVAGGLPLFSRRENDDYAGEHQAPMADSGAPGHDVTGGGNFYPDDVYSANAARYYGTGNDAMDAEAFRIVSGLKGRPNAAVKIYRAVPKAKGKTELLADVQARMKQIMARGGAAPGEYDRLSNERDRLNALPDEAPAASPGINSGDWVTITRGYAKDHGESVHGKGGYAVVSKTVKAKEIFTNGDSIQEWGYDPLGTPMESRRPAADQAETKEFKRWFGESAVVDADGKPRVLYHGTGRRFSRINMKKGPQGLFWMTSDKAAIEAGDVGAAAKGVIMDLYAKITKPAGWAEYDKFGIWELKSRGYDGLILPDPDGSITVATFSPDQVKSADRNNGNFDPFNASILESRRPDEGPRTARSIIADGRVLSLIDEAKAAGADLAAVRDAYARKDGPALVRALDDLLLALAPAPRVTGTKNAVTDAERAAAGKDPILRDAVKTNEAAVYEAMRTVAGDPLAGPEAVARLARGGVEGISLADEAVLLVHKTELVNKREAAAKKLADPDASEDAKTAARLAWEAAEAQIAAVDVAAVNAGREWGRFGQFRQRMMQADFTLAALERKERARLERPLTQEESAKVREMADAIAGLQGKVNALQERLKNVGSERTYEALAKAVTRPPKARPTLEALRKAANDARARLAATPDVPARRGQSGAVLSPSVLMDYAVIGAFHIADGAAKFADWVSAMRADLGDAFDRVKENHPAIFKAAQREVNRPIGEGATVAEVVGSIDPDELTTRDVYRVAEAHVRAGLRGEDVVMAATRKSLADVFEDITEREVRQLFSDYGNASFPSMEEAKVELRQLRSLVQMQESIDRIVDGLAPLRSGPQRDAMTQEVRAKRVQLNELLKTLAKDAKTPGQMRSYNDMRVRNLQNQIEDLQKQIDTGERPAPRAQAVPTPEVQTLIDRRDALVRERDAVNAGQRRNEAEKAALRKKIEGVEARIRGVVPAPRDPVQGADDQEMTALRQRLDALRARRNAVSAEVAAQEGIGKQIADLLQRLAGKDKPARPAAKPSSATVTELRRIRDELAAELRELERAPVDTEARYQEARGKGIAKRIAELQQRIADGDFEPRPRIPRALNDANNQAMFELAKAKEAFTRYQFEDQLRKRSPLGKVFGGVGAAFNLARSVMTSFDLSAPLRQGGFIVMGHPARGLKGIAPMLQAFASAEAEFKAKTDIEARPNAPLYKKFGLELTGIGAGPLSQIEEAYASRWLEKLPSLIGGGLVRGSGRAYSSFLNRLRADSFDAMVASLARGQQPTEAEGKAIARYINVATGRGPIGGRERAGEVMNTVFFAPRLVASRFQLLAGMPMYGGSARTKRMIAMEYARFLTGVAVFMGLAAFALDDDEDDEDAPSIGFDWRSASFGKIRSGNTYIDPLAGLAQVTVFVGRLITGETVNASGKVSPLRQWGTWTDLQRAMGKDIPAHKLTPEGMLGFGESSTSDVIGRFIRSKLAPVTGAIVNSLSGTNMLGEPVSPLDAAQEMVTPMSFGDILDAMEENGVPKGTALGLLVIFGMGVSTRGEASPLTATATARTDIKERLAEIPVDQWETAMADMRKEYGPVMDGVSLAYYKKDGKFGNAGEPRRTADGMPVLETERLSNPSAMGRNYRAQLEAEGKTEAQITANLSRTAVHHIIPDNVVRQHPMMISARTKLGYDLDQSSNLVGLAKEKTQATEMGDELGHWTDHPFYDLQVVEALDQAQQALRRRHGSVERAPKQEVLDAIRKVEDAMRERIEKQEVPKKDGRLAVTNSVGNATTG